MNPSELLLQWHGYIHALGRRWYSYSAPLDRTAHDADDLSQEIALHAVRRLSSYDPARGAFSTWLSCIARSTASRLRERQLAGCREGKTHNDVAGRLAEVIDREPPDDEPQHTERLHAALEHLGPTLRGIIVEVYGLDGLPAVTAKTLAVRNGVTEAAISKSIKRARRILADRLANV